MGVTEIKHRAIIIEEGTLRPIMLDMRHPMLLDTLSTLVGGYIEAVLVAESIDRPGFLVTIYGNEEGKLVGLPVNVLRHDGEPLVGPLVVTTTDRDGNTVGMTEGEIAQVMIVERASRPVPRLILRTRTS